MSNVFSALFNVGSDPVVNKTQSNKDVLTFSAACETGIGQNKKTIWVRVAYWNNPSKISEYIRKGDQIFISGEISVNEYQKDGATKTSLELNANTITFVRKQKQNDVNKQSEQAQQSRPQTSNNFDDDFNDEIPW